MWERGKEGRVIRGEGLYTYCQIRVCLKELRGKRSISHIVYALWNVTVIKTYAPIKIYKMFTITLVT